MMMMMVVVVKMMMVMRGNRVRNGCLRCLLTVDGAVLWGREGGVSSSKEGLDNVIL